MHFLLVVDKGLLEDMDSDLDLVAVVDNRNIPADCQLADSKPDRDSIQVGGKGSDPDPVAVAVDNRNIPVDCQLADLKPDRDSMQVVDKGSPGFLLLDITGNTVV